MRQCQVIMLMSMMSLATHARIGACLLMSSDHCQPQAGSDSFVSSIVVLCLIDSASLTFVPCFYHAKLFSFSKRFFQQCRTCLLEPGSKQTQKLTRFPSLSHQSMVPPKWAGGKGPRGGSSGAEELLARMVGRLLGVGVRAGASFSTLQSYCLNQPSLPKSDTTMSHHSLHPDVECQLLTMQVL